MSKDYHIKSLKELKTLNDDQTDDFEALILTVFNSTDFSPEEKLEIFSFGFVDDLTSGNSDWLETLNYYFEEIAYSCDLSNYILLDKNFEKDAESTYNSFLTRMFNSAIKEAEFKSRLFLEFEKIRDFNDHLLFIKSLKLIIEFKPRHKEIAFGLVEHLKIKHLIDKIQIENPDEE